MRFGSVFDYEDFEHIDGELYYYYMVSYEGAYYDHCGLDLMKGTLSFYIGEDDDEADMVIEL